MICDQENTHPESLFDIVLRFVSINVESVHSLNDFPDVVGKKIFDQFICLNEYALYPNRHQVKILSCFGDAYKELILESLNLSESLIVFNEYFDSFVILLRFISELCLCFCYLGDSHELFEHLHNFCLLKKLCLKRNSLKDGAIRRITLPIRMFSKGAKNMEYLDLSENMFTDNSIAALAVFQNLQCLDLSGSNISREGIHDLERNCSLKLTPSENTIHPVVTRGWAVRMVEKWHDVCRLRREIRNSMKQDLYYSKKRFLMAKKVIFDSSSKIQFSPVKLVFKRQALIKENIADKSTRSNASESLSENISVPYQKAIEEDIFSQYI